MTNVLAAEKIEENKAFAQYHPGNIHSSEWSSNVCRKSHFSNLFPL